MEIPSARVMPENSYRLGIGQADPYRYYYGAVSPLEGLEIDARVTEILGVKAADAGWSGYGNEKDKSLDLKCQLTAEGKYRRAFSIGLMDPHGTRLYASQYVALSKQLYPFDFTIGFGNGRFGKRPLPAQGEGLAVELLQDPRGWLSDAQAFWGVQFALSEKCIFMVEYSPIRYHVQRDPARQQYFTEPVPSKYNFGLRWQPVRWADVDLTYQRGEQLGANVSLAFDIGQPLIPIYDRPYKEKPEDSTLTETERLEKGLACSGFSDIGAAWVGEDLWIEAQNDKWFYTPKAWAVVMNVVRDLANREFRELHITFMENGIPVSYLHVTREDMRDFLAEKLSLDGFLYLSDYGSRVEEFPEIERKNRLAVSYGLKPQLETYLNDPSGFFRYRLGLTAWSSYQAWSGGSFAAGLSGYPLNTVTSTNEPLSVPVRSDIVYYKTEKVTLDHLLFDQVARLTPGLYGRLGAGLLEVQYAGLDAEAATSILGGRVFLGVGGSLVKKRAPERPFGSKNDDARDAYTTAFLNTRFNYPEHEMALDVKAGRFLAGDKGARITISKFINGVILYAWYSFTGTSVFTDGFNRGYHDKGFGVIIPMRLFEGKDGKTAYGYSLSPWTRDVAQDIVHHNDLFGLMGRNPEIFLDKDRYMMRD